jgi:hypothetical protein
LLGIGEGGSDLQISGRCEIGNVRHLSYHKSLSIDLPRPYIFSLTMIEVYVILRGARQTRMRGTRSKITGQKTCRYGSIVYERDEEGCQHITPCSFWQFHSTDLEMREMVVRYVCFACDGDDSLNQCRVVRLPSSIVCRSILKVIRPSQALHSVASLSTTHERIDLVPLLCELYS